MLKVAHAYEQATSWRAKRPTLVLGAPPAEIRHEAHAETLPVVDGATRQLVAMLATRAGLSLPEPILLQLCKAAPYALEMAPTIPVF